MTTATVHVGGVELVYDDLGRRDGTPVLVLHGFTGSAAAMAPLTDRLVGAHRVLAVDLVGHGRSSAPPTVAPYRMDACVDQVAAVLDAAGVSRAVVVGYSMGGRAALALAVTRPRRVAALVTIGARAGLADPDERAARVVADEALAERILDDGLEWFVDHWMGLPLFASQQVLGAEALADARRQRLANDPVGLANSLRGMGSGAQPPLQEHLTEVTVPVDVVVGALDDRFEPVATDLARRLPDARVHRIDGVGHAAHLEAPDAVAAVLAERARTLPG